MTMKRLVELENIRLKVPVQEAWPIACRNKKTPPDRLLCQKTNDIISALPLLITGYTGLSVPSFSFC